jgi:hypothetical protein
LLSNLTDIPNSLRIMDVPGRDGPAHHVDTE